MRVTNPASSSYLDARRTCRSVHGTRGYAHCHTLLHVCARKKNYPASGSHVDAMYVHAHECVLLKGMLTAIPYSRYASVRLPNPASTSHLDAMYVHARECMLPKGYAHCSTLLKVREQDPFPWLSQT